MVFLAVEEKMKFADIPQFTHANWACDYELSRVWDAIEKWRNEDGLNIDPDFQRAHVWKPPQQTAFIEFMLRGGITGRDLYFNHPGWMRDWKGEFVMVDGKQRLEAIRRFFHNEIPAFDSLFKGFTDKINNLCMIRLHFTTVWTKEFLLISEISLIAY